MSSVEWIATPERIAVISSGQGNLNFLSLEGMDAHGPFSMPMNEAGSPISTVTLLRGVIGLGLRADCDRIKSCATTLPEYVIDMIGSFHNAGRTVGNYRKAAARFRELGRNDLSDYLERHAKEEIGHEKLAVRDLNALGYPGEKLVKRFIPPGVAALCELFDRLSSSDYPIGCIGYSYVFESSAAKRMKPDIDRLQAFSPDGKDVTRFMRAHSSLGSEVDHVRDMVAFIAGLPAHDRTEIAKAAYETAVTIRTSIEAQKPEADDAMWEQIQKVSREPVAQAA